MWKAQEADSYMQDDLLSRSVQSTYWDKAIDDDDRRSVHDSLARICEQVRTDFMNCIWIWNAG